MANLYNLTKAGVNSKCWLMNNTNDIFVDPSYNFTVITIFQNSIARDVKFPSPYTGQMCFLSDIYSWQVYYNSTWNRINSSLASLTVTGVSYSVIYVDSSNVVQSPSLPVAGGYTIYKITSGTGTVTPNFTGNVHYLVVGGGGAGSGDNGTTQGNGGGGAGGFITSFQYSGIPATSGGGGSITSQLALTINTSYNVTVGTGGIGLSSCTYNTPGCTGVSSVLHTVTSLGGGAGGYYTGNPGGPGGSGGGAGNNGTSGGSGTPNQGYNGAAGNIGTYGGGGGGAGAAASAQNGGIGLQSAICGGAATYYAGGGGASGSGGAGSGGQGGGGNGVNNGTSNSGTPNTGGGGGAIAGSPAGASGSGGSGIVVIRFPTYI